MRALAGLFRRLRGEGRLAVHFLTLPYGLTPVLVLFCRFCGRPPFAARRLPSEQGPLSVPGKFPRRHYLSLMAAFTEKPKIPLLGNGIREPAASLGTWKGFFFSALVRYDCGVFTSPDSEIPVAFPTDPKQAASSELQKRYEDLVAML